LTSPVAELPDDAMVLQHGAMEITSTGLRIPTTDAGDDCTAEAGLVQVTTVEDLNVETGTSNPLLPADRKWSVRFNAVGTATIVLGMEDYDRGWFAAYFAGLVTARLGIPFRRVRMYYSAALPAVLQTPVLSPMVLGARTWCCAFWARCP